MFRQIARREENGFEERAEKLFQLHPLILIALLEDAWNGRGPARGHEVGLPARLLEGLGVGRTPLDRQQPQDVRWEHLIYAHMVENTGVYEIFEKVLHRILHGNLEGVPLGEKSQAWLRNTEELFYRNPPPFSILSITSDIRPDLRATRRNAYWRMFGMDLVHGKGGEGKPYPYERSQIANTDFRENWRQLLTEVWVGIANQGNTSGPRETDNASLEDLVEKLRDMLVTRRQNGQLAREEFHAVSTMAWFQLTLEFNSPIVRDLAPGASGPEERLIKIGSLVGEQLGEQKKRMDSLFDLADPMSRVLLAIESGILGEGSAAALYTPGPIERDMRRIIRAWSTATGDNIKGGGLASRRPAPVPV